MKVERTMLTRYIQTALARVRYEWLQVSQEYYAEIPELPGVWATGATEEECRLELKEVLEDWIALGLSRNDHIPVISGVDVNVETAQ
jgi:predicted RNase H-like HicB family nuclease